MIETYSRVLGVNFPWSKYDQSVIPDSRTAGWKTSPRRRRLFGAASLIGRASLFVFVLQYYVNFVIVPWLRLPDTPWWPAYFAVSLAVIYLMATLWIRAGLNRLITVGYPFLRARSAHPAAVAAPVQS